LTKRLSPPGIGRSLTPVMPLRWQSGSSPRLALPPPPGMVPPQPHPYTGGGAARHFASARHFHRGSHLESTWQKNRDNGSDFHGLANSKGGFLASFFGSHLIQFSEATSRKPPDGSQAAAQPQNREPKSDGPGLCAEGDRDLADRPAARGCSVCLHRFRAFLKGTSIFAPFQRRSVVRAV